MEEDNKIKCLQCKYYAVSWDVNFPKACKLFGFKSAGIPSVEVYKSSGAECKGFVKKDNKIT